MALRWACVLLVVGPGGLPASAQSLRLNLENLSGPGWTVRNAQLDLRDGAGATVLFKGVVAHGRDFGDVSIACQRFAIERSAITCQEGTMQGPDQQSWALSFGFDLARKDLTLQIIPQAGEQWQLDITGADWRLKLDNASIARVARLWAGAAGQAGAPVSGSTPVMAIQPTAGSLTGTLEYGPTRARADLRITGGAFADAAGLHAGEQLQMHWTLDARREAGADVNLGMTRDASRAAVSNPSSRPAARSTRLTQSSPLLPPGPWTWQTALQWDKGAVFWDPLYVTVEVGQPGHRLEARGSLAAGRIQVDQAQLDWHGLGRVTGSGDLDADTFAIGRYAVSGAQLNLAGLRPLLPQTWLDDKHLGDLVVQGTADVTMRGTAQSVERLAVTLSGAGLQSAQRGAGIDNLETRFDYQPSGTQPFTLNLDALRIRDLKFGPIRTEGTMRDGRLAIPNLIVPVLDGLLALADIEVDRESFALQGALTAVSMEKLTAALGWHPLGGNLSFVLPRVAYAKSTLSVDGALLFKLFDGDAQVNAIRLENPFGRTPQLTADLHLKRMNLEAMTSAVKFGTITGLVDVDVEGLVMERWQPVRMDARVLTSEGAFARRVSQRAVQNISSIGGAGAGAAIQRSFLGFFETFGYDKIGLSCKLRNGICEMGGAENTASGFMLIKGGGLPSVNVVGYNRFVGWQELLDRIQAVIDGNSRPVFQ